MNIGRRWRAVLLVTAGLVVGYFIGPPVAHAAISLVTIQGSAGNRAKVSKQSRLLVDAGFVNGFVTTFPDGATAIAQGTAAVNLDENGPGVVTGVLLDVPPSGIGTGVITIQLVRKSDGAVIYQGSVAGTGGHFNDQLVAGLFIPDRAPSLGIIVTNSGTSAFQFEVHGIGFGSHFARQHALGG